MPRNLTAWIDLTIQLIVIAILVVLLAAYNFYIGAIGAVVWLALAFFAAERCRDRQKKFKRYFESIAKNVNEFFNYAIEGLPQAVLVVDADGRLQWSNETLEAYWGVKPEQDTAVKDYWPDFVIEPIWGTEGEYVFSHEDKHFSVSYRTVVTDELSDSLMVFYVTDITEHENLRREYLASRTVIGYVQIDNYDEVLQGLSEGERTALFFEANKILGDWTKKHGGLLRRVSSDMFVVVMERRELEQAIADKFDILDKIRSMRSVNKIPLTFSIGFAAVDSQSIEEVSMLAQSGLDLSLGRGGDQVAVKLDGKTQFYGGKATAVEKHTRVKARVVAHALKELIEESDEIYVMGHYNEDFDALGSAMGVATMAAHFEKPVKIVLSEMNDGIDKLTELLADKENYQNLLTREASVSLATAQKPLLIVVDTHIPHLVAAPSLLEKFSRIVVIDHHRRSEHCIANPLLLYIEPSSSSTSELVTELLMYYSEDLVLSRIDATALYSGILVDTKNFVVQTGVRTFDAAAYLRRAGADPVLVRQIFRTDYETNLAIAKTKAASELFDGGLIIASCAELVPNAQVVAAQVADSLLRIEDVKMSIVVFRLSAETVGISARSSGELNVQVIMEKFGGGGHQNVAGAQITGVPFEEVYKEVSDEAQKYLKENV